METGREYFCIAPGVTESTIYITDSEGRNIRTHILSIARSSGTTIKASYSPFVSLKDQADGFAKSQNAPGDLIAASSGDFFDMKTGEPEGLLVMEGQRLSDADGRPYFAVLSDGSFVVRDAGTDDADVREAVGGRVILLRGGRVNVGKDNIKHPRQAIGVCADGGLVIVNAEGRRPDSSGMSLHDLAIFMKDLGCKDALNLDGGGSAGLMTKRICDDEPVFRNKPGDGFERKISSAMMIVGMDKGINQKGIAMRRNGKKKRFNTNVPLRKLYGNMDEVYAGLYVINGEPFLLRRGRGITKTIQIGETKYKFERGKYTSSSDPGAGNVLFGYCGIDKYGGRNLVYAWHAGDKMLNIGINPLEADNPNCDAENEKNIGEMFDWGKRQEELLPWYAVRHLVRSVYIADGVTSVGSRFLYMAKGITNGKTQTPPNELKEVRLPVSIKRIGYQAFYNKPQLSEITIPAEDITIGKDAFDEGINIITS